MAPAVAAFVLAGLLAACAGGSSSSGSNGTDGSDDGDGSTQATAAPVILEPVVEPVRPGSFGQVIPEPTSVTRGQGQFLLRPETTVVMDAGAEADGAVAVLQRTVGESLDLELAVQRDDVPPDPAVPTITFTSVGADVDLGREGYELTISDEDIRILARGRAGFGWAVQTIRQLLPAETFGPTGQDGTYALPVGTVRDVPRYAWRGAMLDVTRHFYGVDDVKAFIDEIATYKLNRLHLHLSDDQGWRIEILSHPELAVIGGRTQVGGGEGGFFTQDQYRELVAYAAELGIVVVPEIDLPGHTNAALNADPQLNCDGIAPDPYTGTQVGFSSLCIDLDYTYEWLDDVIGELAELTPGDWIHIGGDESHSTAHADYVHFVEKATAIVADHGKIPMGWEEIGQADLELPAVIQHWSNADTARAGSAQGADVVLSPAPVLYFDMKYRADGPVGNKWAGYTDTRDVYDWDPAAALSGVDGYQVIGLEAPLWTELVTTLDEVQLMTLPRIPAMAEVAWNPGEGRTWDEFAARLATHAPRWDALEWTWTRDTGIPWP
ncbi:MAG: beta-N-acetylhexosaminidase [Aquihabitans sp.]